MKKLKEIRIGITGTTEETFEGHVENLSRSLMNTIESYCKENSIHPIAIGMPALKIIHEIFVEIIEEQLSKVKK